MNLHAELKEWTDLITNIVNVHNQLRPELEAELEEGQLDGRSRARLTEALKHFNVTVSDAWLDFMEHAQDIDSTAPQPPALLDHDQAPQETCAAKATPPLL